MNSTESAETRTLRFIAQFGEHIVKYDISKLEYVKIFADRLNKLVEENEILRDPIIASLLLDGLRYRRQEALK